MNCCRGVVTVRRVVVVLADYVPPAATLAASVSLCLATRIAFCICSSKARNSCMLQVLGIVWLLCQWGKRLHLNMLSDLCMLFMHVWLLANSLISASIDSSGEIESTLAGMLAALVSLSLAVV